MRRPLALGEEIKCLGIESTAHTFSVSVVTSGREILSDEKSVYKPPEGRGIHPTEAAQLHHEVAPLVVKRALLNAGVGMSGIHCVAYSAGPGLGPCLRVGGVVARTLALKYRKPLTPVHHAIGHIELANLLTKTKDPLVLLVSGGHTQIVCYLKGKWRIFGETLDITLGQLFDQLGREMGYGSPAGHIIEALALEGQKYLDMPYVVKGNDVSFSGLLTRSKDLLKRKESKEDVAFSVQETAFAIMAEVVERALAFTEKREVLVTGGVAANRRLKEMLESVAKRHGAELKVIPIKYSGDCGAQIAWVGVLQYLSGITVDVDKGFVRQDWRADEVNAPWREF